MKRSKHSLTHYKLFSAKMGLLIPCSWFEVLPGDTIQMSTSALVRANAMVTPAMHPCHIRIHHFFVPNRIIWGGTIQNDQSNSDSWEAFITGGSDGLNATIHPWVKYTDINGAVGNNCGQSTLGDYLGLRTSGGTSSADSVNALPFRAYQAIWNEYFRDQDLQGAAGVAQTSGHDTTTYTGLQNIAWEKDYLTSSRPWEVKGSSITIPLGTTAPVIGIGVQASVSDGGAGTVYESEGTGSVSYPHTFALNQAGLAFKAQTTGAAGNTNRPQIFADLSNASAVTINTLRHALAVQRFEEARARYGSRYTEYLRYLGVRSSDARLQRPEYLGGGRATLQISEVLNTTATNPASLYGHGIAATRSNRFRRFFEEHGIVMTMFSVRPRTMYSQATNRAWLRGQTSAVGGGGVIPNGLLGTKEDYWQRELQHIGQQQVNGAEADAQNAYNTTFGYQDRYGEYRRMESSVAGTFRSSFDTWQLSREFGSAPSLNSTFVSCVPSTRIFADTTNDNLLVMAHHSIQARRLVSREGNSLTF